MESKRKRFIRHLKHFTLFAKLAFENFKKNDPLRLAASTAFFATFALPAIIVVLLQLFGMFFNRREFGQNILEKLSENLGTVSADEIRSILRNIYAMSETWYITVLGFIFLLFVSTTLFVIIRNTINQLWSIRVKEHPGFKFHIKQRAKSLGIISLGGFLLFIVFLLEGIRIYLEKEFGYLPILGNFLNELIFLTVATTWFSIAFRFIADGRPYWRISFLGSTFTAILFTVGKIILKTALINSNINEIYGTSGAILLVMLYIFYSSFIFYYGACFIQTMSEELELPIKTTRMAYKFKLEEIKGVVP